MSGQTLQHKVSITNSQGLHMRPSAAFAEMARRFQSSVTVSFGGKTVNGKSPLDLMLLVALPGSELTLQVDGPDAQAALEALVALLNNLSEEEADDAGAANNGPARPAEPSDPLQSSQ